MLLALLASLSLVCAPVAQRVLVFNIEYGGDLVDFAKTVEVVERTSPDIVLIEEAWGQIPRLARALRWSEYDVRHQVLARRPLLDPTAADGRFLYAELSPGCVIAIANVHLPSDPDPPDVMPDAASVEAGMEIERRSRLRALEPTLGALRPLLETGVPALLGGDFNAPSHLDDGRYPWPVSHAIADAGLRDVWREVHKDSKTRPGYTWWAARPQVKGWNPSPRARQVRIDQLHAGGKVAVKDVRIVGEAGREGVDIGIDALALRPPCALSHARDHARFRAGARHGVARTGGARRGAPSAGTGCRAGGAGGDHPLRHGSRHALRRAGDEPDGHGVLDEGPGHRRARGDPLRPLRSPGRAPRGSGWRAPRRGPRSWCNATA